MPKVKVNIFGQTYSIVGDGDPDYVAGLAEFVDAKMQEVASQTNEVSTGNIAVLSAINIAHELHTLKQEMEMLLKEINRHLK